MLDPHASAGLRIDVLVAKCDELNLAHGNPLPKFN